MSVDYRKSKAAAEQALELSIRAGSLETEKSFLSAAMINAILALAEAIRDDKKLNVVLDGKTRVYLDGGLATIRGV